MTASFDNTRDNAVASSGIFSKITTLTSVGVAIMLAGLIAGIVSPIISLVGAIVYLILGFVLMPKIEDDSWSPTTTLFASGLFCFSGGTCLGPIAAMVAAKAGVSVVIAVLAGCTGVMAACGLIAQIFHWVRFERMAGWLLVAMLGLLAVAIVGIFVTMSSGVNLVVSGIGAIVMSLVFLVYFGFAMREAENTWKEALMLSLGLMSALIALISYVLQFILALMSDS